MKKSVSIYKNGIKINVDVNVYSWNVNNCRCEMKKLTRLIQTEEFDVETDEIPKNKTIECESFLTLIKKVKDCKSFIGVSILFLCISIILIINNINNWNNNLFLFQIKK